jgi:hypothetical protein
MTNRNTFVLTLLKGASLTTGITVGMIALTCLFLFIGTMIDAQYWDGGTYYCNISTDALTYISRCAALGLNAVIFYLVNAISNLLELGYLLILVYLGIHKIPLNLLKWTIMVAFCGVVLLLPVFFNMGLGFIYMDYIYDYHPIMPNFRCNPVNVHESLTVECMIRGLLPIGLSLIGINILITIILIFALCFTRRHFRPNESTPLN